MAAIYDAMGNYVGEDDTGPGVRSASGLDNSPSKTEPAAAPPKATSAPSGNTKFDYQGLCAAMNEYEQQLVQDKVVEIANEYHVELVGELKSAKLVMPGTTDKDMTPSQSDNSAKSKIDSNTNSMNKQALNRAAVAGTQMIQFIEQVVRNSSYITDQQKAVIDTQSGDATKNESISKNNTTRWFKISVNAVPIGNKIDKKRNDYAYKITYIVSPYGINQAESQYFPQATYRGIHKVYNYWFTGENTQVLQYEQNYHALYFDVMDGKYPVNETGMAKSFPGIASPWQNTRVPTTAAAQSDQGAKNGANNPASTLADYLYSIGDQGSITLRIVGDPAWIQQGEVLGLNALTFNFNGFYPDGTINTDAQQPSFALNWNSPADYDLNSGLMNVNASATKGNNNNLQKAQPAQTAAYQGLTIKSYFNKGKFEQELTGSLIKNLNQKQLENAAAEGRPKQSTADSSSRQGLLNSSREIEEFNPFADTITHPVDPEDFPSDISGEPESESAPNEPPSSNGDIEQGQSSSPPVLSVSETNNVTQSSTGVEYTEDEAAARDAYYAAGKPTSGPVYEAAVSAKSNYARRVADLNSNSASVSSPQTMAPRDD